MCIIKGSKTLEGTGVVVQNFTAIGRDITSPLHEKTPLDI